MVMAKMVLQYFVVLKFYMVMAVMVLQYSLPPVFVGWGVPTILDHLSLMWDIHL